MKFIELPLLNDYFVSINPLSIAYVEPCPGTHYCNIHFNGTSEIININKDYTTIQSMINKALEDVNKGD